MMKVIYAVLALALMELCPSTRLINDDSVRDAVMEGLVEGESKV